MKIKQFLHTLVKPKYKPLNHIEIQESVLLENLSYLQSLQPDAAIFPVLKSNAYGHGLKQVCEILNTTSVSLVVVDSFPEAQVVYENSTKRVLLLGEASLETYQYCDPKRTDFVVYNEKTLRVLLTLFKRPRIHLFVNTGMNREGIKDFDDFLSRTKTLLQKADIVGYCSHLASAELISDLTDKQLSVFWKGLDLLHQYGFHPPFVHVGNSAALFTLHDQRLTAFRPGIAFYGYNVFQADHPAYQAASVLKPALRVLSTVVSLQDVIKGESVSYIEKFHAKAKGKIVIVPFGYFEGLDRKLSNRGIVKVHDTFCPIAGQVCMNLTCINVGQLPIKIGDSVELISSHPSDPNSITAIAKLQGTISYEVLVRLQAGTRREIV